MAVADYLERKLKLDTPINLHLTGCPNSCAQHYMGDIGLIGTKVEGGDDMVDGYHVFIGGGYGAEQGIGREIYRSVVAADVPPTIERMLRAYLENRTGTGESFREFVMRYPTEQLLEMFDQHAVPT